MRLVYSACLFPCLYLHWQQQTHQPASGLHPGLAVCLSVATAVAADAAVADAVVAAGAVSVAVACGSSASTAAVAAAAAAAFEAAGFFAVVAGCQGCCL